ncbi:MAG TPA: hypothetical protein VMT79_07810 [Candidatus Binatia bacterium]|jgi:hypothetical protein|nr:hypothetical protein [Candidatus Binatia bacterium]
MRTSRWLSSLLLLAVALAGPLAPLSASAQMESGMATEPTPGDATGAVFMNIVYVPGKAIVCGAGTVMATFLMLITFGSGYATAEGVFKEGCHGTWVLTPEHVSGKVPPDWVRTDNYQTYYPQSQGVYP